MKHQLLPGFAGYCPPLQILDVLHSTITRAKTATVSYELGNGLKAENTKIYKL